MTVQAPVFGVGDASFQAAGGADYLLTQLRVPAERVRQASLAARGEQP